MVVSAYELVQTATEDDDYMRQAIPNSGGLERRTILGGFTAGLVRSVLECPFEYVKVRRMTGQAWHPVDCYKGFMTLAPRSILILTMYFAQVDSIQRHTSLMDSKIGQFAASGTAALVSYWLCWPLEVLRNVTQADVAGSGNSTIDRARFIYR